MKIIFLLLFLISCGQEVKNTPNGVDGVNSLIFVSRSSNIQECGSAGVLIATGLDLNRNKILDSIEIENISYLCDGKSIESVEYEISELIVPCGNKPGQFNESLLKLGNGSILAYFEQGSNRFLSVLPAGIYETSDGKHCRFEITEAGEYIKL